MEIKCAAIRYKGKIYEGESHAVIGIAMIKEGVCKPPYPHGHDQGFITVCGKYAHRDEALKIAIKAKQVESGKTVHPEQLFSEDLLK